MDIFNNSDSVGSFERVIASRRHGVSTSIPEQNRLVKFTAYCLNPNHFHFIIQQVTEKGIERFMHKLGMGHSKFINTKYKRSGALFQGSFQAIHIDSNEYLLHLSAYINLNDKVHRYRHGISTKSSWKEYINENYANPVCDKDIILGQFRNNKDYKKFAEESLCGIVERKIMLEEFNES